MGQWNPSKKTEFSLRFRTFSPDGLLLYFGKEVIFISFLQEKNIFELIALFLKFFYLCIKARVVDLKSKTHG